MRKFLFPRIHGPNPDLCMRSIFKDFQGIQRPLHTLTVVYKHGIPWKHGWSLLLDIELRKTQTPREIKCVKNREQLRKIGE